MKVTISSLAGLLTACLALALGLSACSTTTAERTPPAGDGAPSVSALEEQYGIRIEGIRLTAAGTMLDFRYRIVDPDRAVALVDRTKKPYLIDQASGLKVAVPSPAKLGPLRATDKYGKPKAGRTYYVLFGNPGRFIEQGSRVTVVIGEFRAEDLVVR
ncbi:MAG: hypothetical protein Kow0025_22950 [Thermodesulfovibrionales bacterium]